MFTQNKDFYPTPTHLIDKMLNMVDLKLIHSILEPSAGKGDIVEVLKNKKSYLYKYDFDIDCIEIEENLRHILKGNGNRVVFNDFLQYDTMKEYDLIIMNPPFSDGCKHLLKALEMQKRNGGQVVCLLNAETLKNPYTNDRKYLSQLLTQYGAKIEYMQNGFTAAERKTGVETVLISVKLPEVKRDSFIISGLRKAQERAEAEQKEQTNLTEGDFITSIINQYKLEVEAGIKLIKEFYAMKPYILTSFEKDKETGETIQTGGCILSMDIARNREKYRNILSVNNYIREVRRKYWEALFNNPQFTDNLTGNLKTEYFNRIEELQDYEFSEYNIYEIKIDMLSRVTKGVEDTILALFDELSQKHSWYDETSRNIRYYNGWKTNKAHIINKKVIIPLSAYSSIWGSYEPADYKIKGKLQDIEKCFNYLDNGNTDPVDITEALKFAEEYGETKNIQLKYFTVTFYKKGTCHITFTSDELLKKFNIFGSQRKGWLPPSYGKKSYNDMTQEEKAVINDFEGEQSYTETMRNTDYYLFDSSKIMMLEEAS